MAPEAHRPPLLVSWLVAAIRACPPLWGRTDDSSTAYLMLEMAGDERLTAEEDLS